MRYAYSSKAGAVVPTGLPEGWPDGWEVPGGDGPWPPGWPIAVATYRCVADLPSTCWGTNELPTTIAAYLEKYSGVWADTADLVYHLLKVTATIDGVAVEMKKTVGGAWTSLGLYYQATNYTGSKHGFSAPIYLNLSDSQIGKSVVVTVSVVSATGVAAVTDSMEVTEMGIPYIQVTGIGSADAGVPGSPGTHGKIYHNPTTGLKRYDFLRTPGMDLALFNQIVLKLKSAPSTGKDIYAPFAFEPVPPGSTVGRGVSISIYPILADFTPESVTWLNQPSLDAEQSVLGVGASADTGNDVLTLGTPFGVDHAFLLGPKYTGQVSKTIYGFCLAIFNDDDIHSPNPSYFEYDSGVMPRIFRNLFA